MSKKDKNAILGDRGRSIPLSEVVSELGGQDPNLMFELCSELSKSGEQISEITCSGTSLGRQFIHLSDRVVPEFTCTIGSSTLTINATRIVMFDDTGAEGPTAPNAKYISLSGPTWSWA